MDSVMTLVRAQGLRVEYPVQTNPLARLYTRHPPVVHALDGIDLDIHKGEILGLVGESGSGKTTLGRVLVKLLRPTSGRIFYEGGDITDASERAFRPLRRKMQIIFQDPQAALNPAMLVGTAIGHPMIIHGLAATEEEARPRVIEVMEEVGLVPAKDFYEKFPAELSGGQKQRAVIARAMILNPSFIVADEPVAMLDMSVRARILDLMLALKAKHDLTYLFITHDLATAKFLCDRLAIMYLGRIVELGDAEAIYRDPKHPYTLSLLRAVPIPDPTRREPKILPSGEVPDAIQPPHNCHFHPRCPSAIRGCGWEPRDLIQFLTDRRATLSADLLERDTRILGEPLRAQIHGHQLRLRPRGATPEEAMRYVEDVLQTSQGPLFDAAGAVGIDRGFVTVQFQKEVPVRETLVDGRRLLCILYQPETNQQG